VTEADDQGTTTRTVRSPFGIEVDRREAHLAALPGKRFQDWFDSLDQAAKVFSGNSAELEKHLTQFVGKPISVHDLPDDFGDEAARLLHNYLAALATLRDTQRMVHHQLWPEPDEKEPKRTKWEVTVWDPKLEQLYGDDPIRFLVKLRDYSLHYRIPVVTAATNLHSTGGPAGLTKISNVVAVARNELLKWDGWNVKACRYITDHDGEQIELVPLVALYSTRVRVFIQWFFDQLMEAGRADHDEYRAKNNEYWLWRHVEGSWGQYGPDGRRVQFPQVAEARLKRAEFPTSGWRLISPDAETGEWVVGERDPEWPPLPRGPR
jgi:hypothetical protein